MILLTANRLDVYDGFQFRIEAAGRSPAITGDPDTAAEVLSDLGVHHPFRLVSHVRVWGSVEIVEHSPRRN